MKIIITIFLLFSFSHLVATQEKNGSKILLQEEVKQLFPDSIKEKFNMNNPIRRVYSYNDNSGDYLVALTESVDEIINRDTLHHRIKAFHFKCVENQLEKVREINDFIEEGEFSIWFWTRYIQFTDIDEDGLIEPIILYGTHPENLDGFRVRILIYYKDKKYAIRHHNCDLDYCRFTQIDEGFYNLPQSVIEHTKNIIREIESNNHAYFGHWENAIVNRKKRF